MKRISLGFVVLGAMFASCGSPKAPAVVQQSAPSTPVTAEAIAKATGKGGLQSQWYECCDCECGGGGTPPTPIVMPPAPIITTPDVPPVTPIDWNTPVTKVPVLPKPPLPTDCIDPILPPVTTTPPTTGGGGLLPMAGSLIVVGGTTPAANPDCPPVVPVTPPKPDCPTVTPLPVPTTGGAVLPMAGLVPLTGAATTNPDCPPVVPVTPPAPPVTPPKPDCPTVTPLPTTGGAVLPMAGLIPLTGAANPDCPTVTPPTPPAPPIVDGGGAVLPMSDSTPLVTSGVNALNYSKMVEYSQKRLVILSVAQPAQSAFQSEMQTQVQNAGGRYVLGLVSTQFNSTLINRLGVTQYPSLVALYKGQVLGVNAGANNASQWISNYAATASR